MSGHFVVQDLISVQGLVYFCEPQSYVTRSIMLLVGPPSVNRSEVRAQTKSDLKDPHEGYKMSKCMLPKLGLPRPTPEATYDHHIRISSNCQCHFDGRHVMEVLEELDSCNGNWL